MEVSEETMELHVKKGDKYVSMGVVVLVKSSRNTQSKDLAVRVYELCVFVV